ncbi:hypothetical protein FLAVO9AF_290096 [Flavobacterium sp. 9AF]|uniref:hypothetical protein n=1 Tax=Flavobacterium sp. 9AF TaxID=2653142 RepID=UPI0012EF70DD|nr:hypothetical protein [Flavobacterium sp. 9AF]VXB83045.1 hypothetical protein FLAVO9AF_290096 [Flavobacterium sp. 9AF]
MKKIAINRKENSINILKVLKFLYRDGTEINSLEDVSKFFNLYEEYDKIEIEISDEILQEIKDDLNFLNVIYYIV